MRARLTPDLEALPADAKSELVESFDPLRAELGVVVGFPAEVLAAAEASARAPRLPSADATDIAFVTVDPPGSRDLDQALHLAAKPGGGYVVRYAIADVAAFVAAGDPVDTAARARGETMYAPDVSALLHPSPLSEGAASLLPDQSAPAFVWTIELDGDGAQTSCDVRRAMVRSRQQLDYPGLQAALDAGTAPEPVALLGEIGRLRREQARARHSLDLPLPEQQVLKASDGGWTIELRAQQPVETWNAEISLLTGMVAGQLMVDGKVGLLRTLPRATDEELGRVLRIARHIGIDWPQGQLAGDVLAKLDPAVPINAAFAELAAELLRGAAYTAFDGAAPSGEDAFHAGIGAIYAHVTAPLRRLGDRFSLEVCAALVAGVDIPEWARAALPELPDLLAESSHRSHALDRGVVDLTEAWLLRPRIGETFDAVVLESHHDQATIAIEEPAVRARCDGKLPLGQRIKARLVEADPTTRRVRFTPA